MYTLIVILHVIVSITLILIILLQTGKGTDIGAVFGGGSSQTLFGSTGPTSFLSKLTAGAAVVFMITSLFLAYFAGGRVSSTIMKGAPASAMPGPVIPPGQQPGMPNAPGGALPAPGGAPPAQAPAAPAQPGR
ncbi:MAG: preprotein translocase subunit SecG [Deltaproteobacteria bacterium]|nr:preprotein translocase subunit SecG [Deltaproteobacteria bacterium]